MRDRIILDAGPLVAYLQERDGQHAWATETFAALASPFFTCEAVLAEAAHLLERGGTNPDYLFGLVESRLISVPFALVGELPRVRQLMARYRDLPMSLADACLVRMTEVLTDCTVLTLDSHFRVYRRLDRMVIPVIMPAK